MIFFCSLSVCLHSLRRSFFLCVFFSVIFILHLLTHSVLVSDAAHERREAERKAKKKKWKISSDCVWRFEVNTFQHSAKCHLMKFMSNGAKCFHHYFGLRWLLSFIFLCILSFFSARDEKKRTMTESQLAFQDNVRANYVPIETIQQQIISHFDVAVQLTQKAHKQISSAKFSLVFTYLFS